MTIKIKGAVKMAKADPNGMTNAAGIAYGDLIRRQRERPYLPGGGSAQKQLVFRHADPFHRRFLLYIWEWETAAHGKCTSILIFSADFHGPPQKCSVFHEQGRIHVSALALYDSLFPVGFVDTVIGRGLLTGNPFGTGHPFPEQTFHFAVHTVYLFPDFIQRHITRLSFVSMR